MEYILEKKSMTLKIQRFFFFKTLKKAQKVILPSTTIQNLYKSWKINTPSLVIPNMVDTAHFQQNRSEAKVYDLVTSGRLISLKQIDVLIRASADLNVSLLVIGEGPDEMKLKSLAERLNARVEFSGSIGQELLPTILNRCRVFVLLSKFEAGTPFSLIEAKSCGLYCVGTFGTGSEDVIRDGIDGALCKASDYDALLVTLRYALDHPELQEKISMLAQQDARERFDSKKNFVQIYSLLSEV